MTPTNAVASSAEAKAIGRMVRGEGAVADAIRRLLTLGTLDRGGWGVTRPSWWKPFADGEEPSTLEIAAACAICSRVHPMLAVPTLRLPGWRTYRRVGTCMTSGRRVAFPPERLPDGGRIAAMSG
jgi:hypothetical protein